VRFIGVISDTHGLLRPQALAALRGSASILHAGDIGSPQILEALAQIAPVAAVRGNIDRGSWAEKLPPTRYVQVEQHCIYLLHNLDELDLDPVSAGLHAIISGHSHRQKSRRSMTCSISILEAQDHGASIYLYAWAG
jgi:putative phosphoesterase